MLLSIVYNRQYPINEGINEASAMIVGCCVLHAEVLSSSQT